ncbi:MAG: hypothetical protein Q4A27_03470 [bacterium]|nr:hypothetical protein [bacterium]
MKLKMEDCDRNYALVAALSSELTNLRTQMSDYFEERNEAFEQVAECWSDFEKTKKALKKAKKDFSKGKIDEDEFCRFENEFYFRKRCSKRLRSVIKAQTKKSKLPAAKSETSKIS